ncbi:hypothetical protein BB409_02470 [Helicobacter pylori]|uniref:hypothetical protein n=1 Tax=Helicobacter pylori TaxID=210 RepID=UPI0004254B97|nr:hypothetical protein [Helicobacter pylori]OPG61232.1 hypothetical protein BGL87_07955 [Helicobacter pylori]PDW16387.1 hypothetical protein BB409_02470 [Helicobacter pylori]
MKTSQSKKSNPKTKGSVLSVSLVFKNPLSNKSLNPHPLNTIKKENKKERNQQRENPLLERRKRFRS